MLHKPWSDGNHSAYPLVDRVSDIRESFKRFRSIQHFILADEGVEKDKPNCSRCGELITVETGNRGEYYPHTKQFVLYHYFCAWGQVMDEVTEIMNHA